MGNYNFGNYIYQKRVEKGLSQTDLGNLLGITNKTISKWENGQGFPSLELMLPLAKVLNVTVEELHKVIANNNNEISPTYFSETETTFTKELLAKALYKGWNKNRISFLIICIIFFTICVISLLVNNNGWSNEIIIPLVLIVLSIFLLIRTFNQVSKYISSLSTDMFIRKYYLYDDYILNNNKKINYTDITKKLFLDDYLYIQTKKELIVINMDNTKEINQLLKLLNLQRLTPKENKIKKILNTFIILSIFSLFFSLITIAICIAFSPIPDFPYAMQEYMWVFYIYIPIPMTSLILAIIYYKRRKAIINIIIGIVGTIVLFIYGSFIFLINIKITHDNNYIKEIETILSMDIPESNQISTAYINNDFEKIVAMVKINEQEKDDFIKYLVETNVWKDQINTINESMLYTYSITIDYDYFLLYNITIKSYYDFNETILSNNEYIFMAYNIEKNILFISNYISK